MRSAKRLSLLGVGLAIAITTTMDATGYTMFSALPLLPLTLIFWRVQRFSRAEMGLVWGRPGHYVLALAYPAIVMGVILAIAWPAGAIDTSDVNWRAPLLNLSVGSTVGILMALLTEEGFFRGWLWASLRRAGKSDAGTLVWSTVAFTLWHVSPITLDTGYNVPLPQIPVYLVNATLIGAVWGMLRLISGSIVVASVSHAVWNAFAYTLFGFGTHTGASGIERTDIFGPEVGLLGLVLNAAFAALLWFGLRSRAEAGPSGARDPAG